MSRPRLPSDDLPPAARPLTIVDFLTDGALATFLSELSMHIGARVSLRNVTGAIIEEAQGDPPWVVHDPLPRDLVIAQALANRAETDSTAIELDAERTLVPLTAQGQAVGGLLIEGESAPTLRHAVGLLASMISDLCTRERHLQARNDELALLFRVASLFVTAQKLENILEIALSAAGRVLGSDAAMVHLGHGDSDQLRALSHVGLSATFVKGFDANTAPRAADPAVREGRAISVPDLREVGDHIFAQLFEREGLSTMLVCGLVHRGRFLGALRLFRRSDKPFTRAQQALLQTLAEQIAGAVASAELAEQERQADHMRRQLQLASDVQRRMLPADRLVFPGLDLAARYVSALSVSGDFYDVIELGGNVGLVVGDVVGKGVPAALLMASVRSLFRAHALDLEPDEQLVNEVVRRVNVTLARDTLPSEFATAFFAMVSPAGRTLTYCNAGHDPPLVFRATRPALRPERLDQGGGLLGMDERHAFERGTIELAPGDTVIAYTDGVTDAMNYERRKFGRTRLIESVRDQLNMDAHSTARTIVERVVWDVRRYVGLNTDNDDLTVMVMRVK